MIIGLKHIGVFLFLILPFVAFSTLDYNKNIENAHASVLKFEYTKANAFLNLERQNNPSNTYIEYIESYQLFLKAYFDAKQSDYDTFIKVSEACMELLKNEANKEKALQLSAMISIQRAYIFFLWAEHYSYVRAIMKGQSFVDQIKSESNDIENLKIKSIYEVIGGSVPSKYKTYAKWFDIKGTPKKGIQFIDDYLSKVEEISPNHTEGELVNLYLRDFLDIEIPALAENKPELLTYVYLQTTKESAINKISRIDSLSGKTLPSYFIYLKAKYLLELQKEDGFTLMNQYIQQQDGISYRHSAHYYIAWYFCSMGNKISYTEELEKIKFLPAPLFPSDRKVIQRLENPGCNSSLIKARMLFDAGEYQQAETVLKQKEIKSQLITAEEKIEYLYRLARVYEMTSRTEKALELYQKVIDTRKSKLYFISYSAYRSGKIYESLNKIELARQSYKLALELNEGEYKTSIEKKCQYALDYIKK